MSVVSDKFEQDVANVIKMSGIQVKPTKSDSNFSDICIIKGNQDVWVEVKMSHNDNLGNTRVSYILGEWTASFDKGTKNLGPIKKVAISYLSQSQQTIFFLKDIATFSGLNYQNMILSSLKSSLKNPNSIPHNVVVDYFKNQSQYILDIPNVNLGELVSDHYLRGKSSPAYYMQAGDDFYIMDRQYNILSVPNDVPDLKMCYGNFKMRISIRRKFYEIQPEIKITNMPYSKYSLKPGTTKKNPFLR